MKYANTFLVLLLTLAVASVIADSQYIVLHRSAVSAAATGVSLATSELRHVDSVYALVLALSLSGGVLAACMFRDTHTARRRIFMVVFLTCSATFLSALAG